MGTQIWPNHKKVQGHPRIIFWTNLVDTESPMLYTKIPSQGFLSSGEDFQVQFGTYMDIAAISFKGVKPFEQIVNIHSTESPIWNLE